MGRNETDCVRAPTRELVDFLQALSLDALPASAVDSAKWCLLDTLGCALFGVPEPWSQIMAAQLIAEGSKGRSTIVGHVETVAAPAAALCNGTAAHGFELDDHLDEAIVHPGAIIISAALATAEAIDAPGSRLVPGIIAGYEMLNRLGLAMGVKPSQHGWHKTAVAGPVGAAVAASVVMKLGAGQMLNAVGLACATASGTKAFAAGEGGGMEKRMHAGHASSSGVRAAQLAARGFTSPPGAIEGRFGLLDVMSGDTARAELLAADLGRHWAVEHVYVKLYPCCAWIQAAAQQLVSLRGQRPLDPGQIAKVQVGVSAYARAQNGNPLPQDTMGAQFSIPYCTALALTGDPADPASYAPEAIPAQRALAQRVEIVVDPEMEAAYPRHYGARVRLELANGEIKTSSKLDPHGMPADPCTEAEVLEKFSRLASRVKSRQTIERIVEKVRAAERLSKLQEITALLRP
jgi:2-methylcitrate dehydratase PrpD